MRLPTAEIVQGVRRERKLRNLAVDTYGGDSGSKSSLRGLVSLAQISTTRTFSTRTFSTTLVGIEAMLVNVETQILGALKRFTVVGLPDGVVREARDRVRAAIEHGGFSFPYGEVIVSLGPATLPKAGSGFDLAIAVTILAAMNLFDPARLQGRVFLGELGLDGTVRPVPGVLAAACCARTRDEPLELFVSHASAQEAMLAGEGVVRAVASLEELVGFLSGVRDLPPSVRALETMAPEGGPLEEGTLGEVVGQYSAKRALEIAAAGAHNLCMIGPPGSGKTMLAKRLRGVLPPLNGPESLEVTKIYAAYAARGVAYGGAGFGELGIETWQRGEGPHALVRCRPFRAPHHSTSAAGLVGGGATPMPGEISLAHRGVLFLDELPELRRDALECLREPLETRSVVISRARFRVTFPADFILVAAMNPCPCGKRGVSEISCRCTPQMVSRYLARISGPILDRIDLQIWVPPVAIEDLGRAQPRDNSAELFEGGLLRRIGSARRLQHERLGSELRTNSSMSPAELRRWCSLDSQGQRLMEQAGERLKLSARAYTRVLKVARTVADLEGECSIEVGHLAEVLSYRATVGL